MDFIADFEGFRECAYWDAKQWSIGYGTKSYQGECITREEAKKRKIVHLQPLIELVNTSCYNDNQKVALVSYMYNVGRFAMNIQEYVKRCDHDSIRYIMSVYGYTMNGQRARGLEKRRAIEINKYNQS